MWRRGWQRKRGIWQRKRCHQDKRKRESRRRKRGIWQRERRIWQRKRRIWQRKRCHQDRGKAKGRGCLAGRRFTGCRKGRRLFLDGTACGGSKKRAGRGQNLIRVQEIERGTWLGREIPGLFPPWHGDCFARGVRTSVDYGGAGRAALPMWRHFGGNNGIGGNNGR